MYRYVIDILDAHIPTDDENVVRTIIANACTTKIEVAVWDVSTADFIYYKLKGKNKPYIDKVKEVLPC